MMGAGFAGGGVSCLPYHMLYGSWGSDERVGAAYVQRSSFSFLLNNALGSIK